MKNSYKLMFVFSVFRDVAFFLPHHAAAAAAGAISKKKKNTINNGKTVDTPFPGTDDLRTEKKLGNHENKKIPAKILKQKQPLVT